MKTKPYFNEPTDIQFSIQCRSRAGDFNLSQSEREWLIDKILDRTSVVLFEQGLDDGEHEQSMGYEISRLSIIEDEFLIYEASDKGVI